MAAAGSSLELATFAGEPLSFSLTAVLLALLWLGLPAGLLVAAAQATATTLVYDQPWAFVMVGSQVVFVSAWLKLTRGRRREAPLMPVAIGLYWMLVGAPLTLLFGLFWIDLDLDRVLSDILKQTGNDLIAAFAAELLVLAVGALRRRKEDSSRHEGQVLSALQAETLDELLMADADEQRIAEQLCQRIAGLLPDHECSLTVTRSASSFELVAASGMNAEQIANINSKRIDWPEHCLHKQDISAFDETFAFPFDPQGTCAQPECRSIAAMQREAGGAEDQTPSTCWCRPVLGEDGRPIAVLSLSSPIPITLSRFAQEVLEHGARLAAVALGNLRLRREHRFLLDALSQAETGIVIAERGSDGNDPVRFVSRGFENLTGYSAGDVLGRDCRFLQGTDREQPAREVMRTALSEGRSCQVTIRNYRKDKSLFWNTVSITPVTDSKGRISHFIGVQRDDTERRQALERLSASESQLREIAETIEEVFWVQEIGSDRLSYISPAYQAIWEQPIEAVLADSDLWRDSIHPDDRDRVLRAQTDVPADGSPKSLEYRIRTPDGRLKWIADRRFLARDANGRARRVIGVAAEITERKTAELALTEERQRLEQIIEGTRVGTWDWRLQTNEVRCNDNWARMLGYRPDELEPVTLATWRALTHPEDRARVEERLQAHFDGTQKLLESELRMRHKEGHWIWVQTTGRLVERSPDGAPQRVIGIHMEITERKKAELSLIARERVERELVALTTAFVDPAGQPLDSLIRDTLAKVGSLTESDRAYLFQFDHGGRTISNTHEWVADGIEPEIRTLQAIPIHRFAMLLSTLEEVDLVRIPDVAELPDEWAPIREDLTRQHIQSLILVPLSQGHDLQGFLGLDAVRERRDWAGPEVHFLRVLAGALRGALERERVLAELRAGTERYDALALQSRMMTWEIDLDGVYTYVNPVAESLLGYPPEALLGRKAFYDLIPEPEHADVKARAFALLQQGRPFQDFLSPAHSATGERVWLSIDGLPITGDDGALLGYRGSALDVTDVQNAELERRTAEQALQEYTENLERLVNLSNRGLAAADEKAALLELVKDALGMSGAQTGWCAPAMPYQPLVSVPEDAFVLDLHAATEEVISTLCETPDRPHLISGAALPEPLRVRGYQSAVALALRPPGDASQPRWLVTQLWSTRERVALSNAERELLRVIGQRIIAIEHEAQLAKDLVNAKERETIGHLASGVAHDFNNVLAVLDANLYFLRSIIGPADADSESAQVIDEMNSALGQAKVITSGMLALSRAGGVPVRATRLEPPLAELADILRLMLPETVAWHLDVAPGLEASTNAGFLQAALLNLALNGRDAMPDGGTLSVSCQRERWSGEPPLVIGELSPGDYAVLRVSDTGIGMPEAVLTQIFEPLFSTKARQRGHGLGLFMVREFVVRSGAGLAVRSSVGAGTEFQFLLPLNE